MLQRIICYLLSYVQMVNQVCVQHNTATCSKLIRALCLTVIVSDMTRLREGICRLSFHCLCFHFMRVEEVRIKREGMLWWTAGNIVLLFLCLKSQRCTNDRNTRGYASRDPANHSSAVDVVKDRTMCICLKWLICQFQCGTQRQNGSVFILSYLNQSLYSIFLC